MAVRGPACGLELTAVLQFNSRGRFEGSGQQPLTRIAKHIPVAIGARTVAAMFESLVVFLAAGTDSTTRDLSWERRWSRDRPPRGGGEASAARRRPASSRQQCLRVRPFVLQHPSIGGFQACVGVIQASRSLCLSVAQPPGTTPWVLGCRPGRPSTYPPMGTSFRLWYFRGDARAGHAHGGCARRAH